jgi:DNA-binding NarL/FixJ family response regulator
MKTVAIVEHDAIMSLLLAEICQTAGYRVVGRSRDADSAMSMIEREQPDYLLFEFSLGDQGNGLDLLERAKRQCPAMFAIMITAWDINDIASRIHGAQPDRILRKPVHAGTLISVLSAAEEQRSEPYQQPPRHA